MTGLRQGELLALRWRDVDWAAGGPRAAQLRRRRVRPAEDPPLSRAVPLADRVAAELERHSSARAFQADDDLVFCHPQLGGVYDPSKLRRRFEAARAAPGSATVRFHDLRHTFGTRMAAAGASRSGRPGVDGPPRLPHHLIYADYAPDATRPTWSSAAFARGPILWAQSEPN